eukprot:5440252-Pyramimonas_sp.AAC.1
MSERSTRAVPSFCLFFRRRRARLMFVKRTDPIKIHPIKIHPIQIRPINIHSIKIYPIKNRPTITRGRQADVANEMTTWQTNWQTEF